MALSDIAQLIHLANGGDAAALARIFETLYPDLRRIAHSKLRQNGAPGALQTTILVNESFLRFCNVGELQVADKAHFLRYASKVMRSVVVDIARAQLAERRGGELQQITLNTDLTREVDSGAEEIIRVNDAMHLLAAVDEDLARLVELRYFTGLSEIEVAEALGVSRRTVSRDWAKARLFLTQALI